MSEFSRRQFVALASSAAAGVWLTATRSDILAAGLHAAQATKFETLTPADAIEIEAATAQIVPTDETPGAREARVVYFIDKALATLAKDQRPVVRVGGEGTPDARGEGAARRQIVRGAFVRQTDRRAHRDGEGEAAPFQMLRYGTIAGMLANPEWGGNYQKTGWRWIGFDDRFSWAAALRLVRPECLTTRIRVSRRCSRRP